MSFARDPRFSVDEAIRRWVLGNFEAPEDKVDELFLGGLHELVISIARTHLASGPTFLAPHHLEAEDLASEFLLSLRRKGNRDIRTKSGLATEYRRWVAEFSNPAQHELWEIVSTALHALSRENAAWRLDAPASDANNNDAMWTGVAGTAGEMLCDIPAFERASHLIRNYSPPAARKWYADDAVLPKVIAPEDAKELVLALLRAAGGAIRLRDLLEEFKRHVFAFELGAEIDTDPSADSISIHPAAMKRLYDLAHERASVIWDAISAAEGTDLLCDYFIPRNLHQQAVTLDTFGDPRRVKEHLERRVVQFLCRHLALDVAESLDVEDDAVDHAFHSRFVVETMHILCKKCGCRPGKSAQ